MKCVELFAGAGGAAIGLERAGFDAVLRVERDHDACATLRASALRVSNVTRPLLLPTLWGLVMSGVADVRDGAVFRDLGSVDLLWASPPCQAWSMAGSRDGAYDEDRNGFPWTWAAIDAVRPTWAVLENVPGLTYHSASAHELGPPDDARDCAGCWYERVLLPALRARFASVQPWLVDAADFGVPQHRRRIFIMCGPHELAPPAPTHGPGLLPWVTIGQALRLSGARDSGAGSNPHGPGRAHERTERDLTDEPASTVSAAQVGNGGMWLESGHNTERAGGLERARFDVVEPAPSIGQRPPNWRYRSNSHEQVARSDGTRANASVNVPSPTVTATEGRVTSGTSEENAGAHRRPGDALRRRLTVEECAKLQAFPDGWPFQGNATSQYRQVGNAVPPPLAEAVAGRVAEALGSGCRPRSNVAR